MIKQTMAALLLSTTIAGAANIQAGISTLSTDIEGFEASGIQLNFEGVKDGVEFGGSLNSAETYKGVSKTEVEAAITTHATQLTRMGFDTEGETAEEVKDNSIEVYAGKQLQSGFSAGLMLRKDDLEVSNAYGGPRGEVDVDLVKSDDTIVAGYVAWSNDYVRVSANTNGDVAAKVEKDITKNISINAGFSKAKAEFSGSNFDNYTCDVAPCHFNDYSGDADVERVTFGASWKF